MAVQVRKCCAVSHWLFSGDMLFSQGTRLWLAFFVASVFHFFLRFSLLAVLSISDVLHEQRDGQPVDKEHQLDIYT